MTRAKASRAAPGDADTALKCWKQGGLERPALYRAVTASSSVSASCSWTNSSAKPSSRFRTTRACTLPSMTRDFSGGRGFAGGAAAPGGGAGFRGDRGARGGEVDDAAGHLAAVLEREHRNRVARHDTVVPAVLRQV